MGQLVSSSRVISQVGVEPGSGSVAGRPVFVEHERSYVPVVSVGVVYEVELDADIEGVDCVLQQGDFSMQVSLRRVEGVEGGRGYSFTLDRTCERGFYRLQCLDVDTTVFVDGVEDQDGGVLSELPYENVWLPDGSEFRKLIASLEDSVASLQKSPRLKILVEHLSRFHDLLQSLSSVCESLLSIRLDFAQEQVHPLKTLFNEDFRSWVRSFNDNNVLQVSRSLNGDVISPLQELIEFEKQNQKILLKKQKNFHEAVRLMYSSQSSFSLNTKIQYELSRLEYQNFLNQCYIMGPPLRKLYGGISHFLHRPSQYKASQFIDIYMKKNHQLRSAIKDAQNLNDLIKLYSSSNAPHLEGYVLIDFQEGEHGNANSNVSNNGSSSGSHGWHRKWVILDGNRLSLLHHSKKLPMHTVDLCFACIRQVNKTTLEVVTSGMPYPLPALTAVNSSSSSVDQIISSKNHHSKVFLQFKDQLEADRWLSVLKKANLDTKQYSNSAFRSSSIDEASSSNEVSLIDLVMRQHESNSTCCDCGDSQTVEWISINLLCVLCIKCSGVHRSMGSHISKVRSLTLDSFTSPEVLYLLQNNVSNANVNSIYESTNFTESKITPECSDNERSQYILRKYAARMMVNDGNQDPKFALKSLIKAIHLDSIYLLQKTIAQSSVSLRDIINKQAKSEGDEAVPTIFQYSLKHHVMIHGSPVFFITEFLLYNGLPADRVPPDTTNWSSTVINYWKNKVEIYGTHSLNTDPPKLHENRESLLTPLTTTVEKVPNRRWTLNHMSSSPQIKSPTHILSMHKSLKLSKRGGNGTRKD